MLRSALLYLSNQQQVFSFVRNNRLAKQLAMRFVAGETAAEALGAVRQLNARGASASLDLLGESVTNEAEARATRDAYLQLLDRLEEHRLDANVSVKLTAMGQDISEDLCAAIMQEILERARREIESERDRAIAELRREAVDLAIAGASKVVEQNLDNSSNRRLVETFLSSVPAAAGDGRR